MLQVLREKLTEPQMIRGTLIEYGDFFSDLDRTAEVFYLQGHAVMFVIRVDFPLSSPAPAPAAEADAGQGGGGDPVWQRARQRLNSVGRGGLPGQTSGATFERIKETLLQSLKHAANIRNVGPNELIVLTVTSQSESNRSPTPASAGGSYSRTRRGVVRREQLQQRQQLIWPFRRHHPGGFRHPVPRRYGRPTCRRSDRAKPYARSRRYGPDHSGEESRDRRLRPRRAEFRAVPTASQDVHVLRGSSAVRKATASLSLILCLLLSTLPGQSQTRGPQSPGEMQRRMQEQQQQFQQQQEELQCRMGEQQCQYLQKQEEFLRQTQERQSKNTEAMRRIRSEYSEQAWQEALTATAEQWKAIKPKLERIKELNDTPCVSLSVYALRGGVNYEGSTFTETSDGGRSSAYTSGQVSAAGAFAQ